MECQNEVQEQLQPPSKRPRTRRRVLCTHCQEWVSKSTYYRHVDIACIRKGSESTDEDCLSSEASSGKEEEVLPAGDCTTFSTPNLSHDSENPSDSSSESVSGLENGHRHGINSEFDGSSSSNSDHEEVSDHVSSGYAQIFACIYMSICSHCRTLHGHVKLTLNAKWALHAILRLCISNMKF